MGIYILLTLFLMIITYLLTSRFYISRLKKDNLLIDDLTIMDSHTNMYNRHFFNKTFLLEFHRARRIKHPIALMFVQSDDIINLSKILANAIKRDTDFISRYEDKTFAVVLYDTNSDGVDLVIKRILDSLSKDLKVSIGVHAVIPDGHISSTNLLDEAYNALTKSKNKGDNVIEFSLNSI